MLKPAGGPDAKFFMFALVVVGFHAIGIVALVVAGKWAYGPPEMVVKLNPLFTWADGARRVIVSPALFSGWSNATAVASAANFLAWSTLQWLGLGIVLDVARSALSK